MLHGLDLFTGIGGITEALSPWVKPVGYCDIELYSQAAVLSRQWERELPRAPICTDVRSIRGRELPEIDIIYGGFPCQDISVAGRGKGLEGERSGLFFEIMRLVSEVRPSFLFLENVPAITSRGLGAVTAEITKAGYDCRWLTLSASEVGAPHRRERWWLLAYSDNVRGGTEQISLERSSHSSELGNACENVSDAGRQHPRADEDIRSRSKESIGKNTTEFCGGVSNTDSLREQQQKRIECESRGRVGDSSWWQSEPNVGRVVNGLPFRVDRIKCLGNAVVPFQAREAFKELIGF